MATSAELDHRNVVNGVLQRTLRIGFRLFVVLGIVAGITFGSVRVAHVNAMTAGFLYLIAVLGLATTWGLLEAITASIVGALCLDYFFFPPIGVFNIDDPQDWIALVAFLTTSLTTSHLSALARRQAREAVNRQREIERLYALSRAILITDAVRPVAKQITEEIAGAFNFSGVALYDRNSDKLYHAGSLESQDIEGRLREAAVGSVPLHDRTDDKNPDHKDNVVVAPILLAGESIGSLAITGDVLSDGAFQSLLNLIAMGLQKAAAQEAVNRAEVARQGEGLKSKLLDAFAHEFKTPLTSIKAATTFLLTHNSNGLDQPQHKMVTIADRGADRLVKLVNDAILLARIEGGQFHIKEELHSPSSLITEALTQITPRAEGREIRILVEDDLPPVLADGELIQMAIGQLIDNSLKYSQVDAAITVAAQAGETEITISVSDLGQGIPEADQARIFDRFFRGVKDRHHMQGTGMGLTAVREIVRAHGGEIKVRSNPGEGSVFSFSLPIASKEKIA